MNNTLVTQVYRVTLLHSFHDYFTYSANGLTPQIGARVWVPLRNKTRLGVVIAIETTIDPEIILKPIISLIDSEPLFSTEILNLCHWLSRYYQTPLSEVLPLALPKKYRQGDVYQAMRVEQYKLMLTADEAHTLIPIRAKKQHALIDLLTNNPQGYTKKYLTAAGFNSQQLQALDILGIIAKISTTPSFETTLNLEPCLKLNNEQQSAVETITADLNKYHCFLLQGVTGSGKTEVYLQTITQVLALNRQVLVLVPEIGLTPQLVARFTARFQDRIVVIHSNLNDTERQQSWQLAKENQAAIVLGTRAAVLTPMPKLGLIIIDEEHDMSFKQTEGVRYSARDTALMRAYRLNIPIILGTATPSLESIYNCTRNKSTLLCLNHKAIARHPLHYQILDIRHQKLQQGLAAATLLRIQHHLTAGNQVLVFINRRGFAPILLCHQCGWMADCNACDSHLTVHRQSNQLICHHCGRIEAVMTQCRKCNSPELLPVGVGTQRIDEFLTAQFPNTNILRIDRDKVAKKTAFDEHLAKIIAGDVQLIVGTQMMAKGHHFPRLTLVVMLEIDHGFYNSDFRAIERLGQLITQVAGRAGRGLDPGEVIIQTHLPHHPLLNTLIQQGYTPFAEELLELRKQAKLPPYTCIAMIRAQGKQLPMVLKFLHRIKQPIQTPEVKILGPAPAPLIRKSHQHRMQLLIQAPTRNILHDTLIKLRIEITQYKLDKSIQWSIDIDPIDLA